MHISVLKHTKGLDLNHTSLWLGRKTQRFLASVRRQNDCDHSETVLIRQYPQGLSRPDLTRSLGLWGCDPYGLTSRQIHHGPKDRQVVKRVSLITFTDRQHSLTTREHIRRYVRVVRLVKTLHDPYGLYGSYESTHHNASRQNPSIPCYE